jgi:hypothetical protein
LQTLWDLLLISGDKRILLNVEAMGIWLLLVGTVVVLAGHLTTTFETITRDPYLENSFENDNYHEFSSNGSLIPFPFNSFKILFPKKKCKRL